MYSPLISIIVPVYNVERYLRKCLDSVLAQTYRNIEILLVNDGSTDGSGGICDEYALRDGRFRVFHKKNGGVSSARNVGLKNCSGVYVGFVDSDDWIEPDMYETLHKAMQKYGVTISAGSFTRDTNGASVPETAREAIPSRVLAQGEMLLYIFRNVHYAGFGIICCNKLYDVDAIKCSGLLFDEELTIAEDAKFTAGIILAEKSAGYYTDRPLYHYYQREDSAMNSNPLTVRVERIKALKAIAKMSDEKNFGNVTVWLKRELCYSASVLVEEALAGGDGGLLASMRGVMRQYLPEYIETNKGHPERIERAYRLLDAAPPAKIH